MNQSEIQTILNNFNKNPNRTDWENVEVCPLCSMHNVHLHNVTVLFGGDDDGKSKGAFFTNGSSAEVVVGPFTHWQRANGASLYLDLLCENGHMFRKEIVFHKGGLFRGDIIVGEYPECDSCGIELDDTAKEAGRDTCFACYAYSQD